MDICHLVGSNIRALRQKQGLSQEELAFRAQLDRPYLSQIENGKRNITLLILQEIATVLGVSASDLLRD